LATGKVSAIDLGGEYRIFGTDPAGDRLASIRTFDLRPVGRGVQSPKVETHWTDRKTLKHELAIPAAADLRPASPFPDGDRWFVRRDPAKRTLDRMAVYSAKASAFEEMQNVPKEPVRNLAVSPDGQRLAYCVDVEGSETRLFVADANGKAPRAAFTSMIGIRSFSWK
jgi:hypothetical protein